MCPSVTVKAQESQSIAQPSHHMVWQYPFLTTQFPPLTKYQHGLSLLSSSMRYVTELACEHSYPLHSFFQPGLPLLQMHRWLNYS